MANRRYTPAQKRAIDKYRNNTDRLYITVPAGKKAEIKEHADSQGESVNSFVIRAIDETIKRDEDEGVFPETNSGDPHHKKQ